MRKSFERGDAGSISISAGDGLGIGLCAYSSDEARSIIGCQTSEIEKILGYVGRDVIVHRDNIAF